MGQHTRFQFLSHYQATKAQVSLAFAKIHQIFLCLLTLKMDVSKDLKR